MATPLGHRHTVTHTLLRILSRKPQYIFPFYIILVQRLDVQKTDNLCLLNCRSLLAAGLCVHKFLHVCVCGCVWGAVGSLLICA